MAQGLIERYESRLHGVLSCYDRVVVTGTLPGACYAEGMTAFLSARSIRIFDYPRFAEPLRDAIRTRAAELAASAGIEIEHIRKDHIRKEDVVAKVLEKRGDHPGLVHVISAMEACQSYKPWHDKASHKTFLKPDTGKCLHYYFYFIDPVVGLCYLRVPTWCPFRLQFYCNGHGWLARKLKARRIEHTLADNAFVRLQNWEVVQKLADSFKPEQLHRVLDRYARRAARSRRPSANAITGASCRLSTPRIWCFARARPWPRSMSSSRASRCCPSRLTRWPPSSARRSLHSWRRSSARACRPASRAPASSIAWDRRR